MAKLVSYTIEVNLENSLPPTRWTSYHAQVQNRSGRVWDMDALGLASRVLLIGPSGSRTAPLLFDWQTGRVTTGCFEGTLAEFLAANLERHPTDRDGLVYAALTRFLTELVAIDKES